MQSLAAKASRAMRKLDRFDSSSIEEIFLLSRKRPAQDGTSTRRSYPFLESFLCRRSRIAFNGVSGGGLALWSKERRRSFPRINITSRRFFLRIFSIFRIIRFPIYDGGARKIERHPASIRPPEEEKYSNRPELAANAKRSDNESSFRSWSIDLVGVGERAQEESGYPPI